MPCLPSYFCVLPSPPFAVADIHLPQDGTLTASTEAVEAAWERVAEELGLPKAEVIALTHGKRAVDNLRMLKPNIQEHDMDREVAEFENSILFYADAFRKHGPGSSLTVPVQQTSIPSSGALTPALLSDSGSPATSSGPPSRQPSMMDSADPIRPSFVSRLSQMLIATALELEEKGPRGIIDEQECGEEKSKIPQSNALQPWQVEAASVDRSVKILPGVMRMLSSIPVGRYAVATSGAKTYAYGCMARVGISPPPVTITADDKRLKAGKPAPDPFILAARCLGFSPSNCVVFEDSPSGIRAGVASGATVVAVCTSHERAQIEDCGANYIVEDMRQVQCTVVEQGEDTKLRFTVLV
ncbi:HAD-like protein [Mycena latifolia]|nr:HAD-like protein [Mycena latifolia]